MNKTTRNIVTAAVIGALYAVLTMVLCADKLRPCAVQNIRGAVHTSVFHAEHHMGAVLRLCDSQYCKLGRTSGYHLRLACNAYSMPVHIVVRKAQ